MWRFRSVVCDGFVRLFVEISFGRLCFYGFPWDIPT
jgi:hypothetical protein